MCPLGCVLTAPVPLPVPAPLALVLKPKLAPASPTAKGGIGAGLGSSKETQCTVGGGYGRMNEGRGKLGHLPARYAEQERVPPPPPPLPQVEGYAFLGNRRMSVHWRPANSTIYLWRADVRVGKRGDTDKLCRRAWSSIHITFDGERCDREDDPIDITFDGELCDSMDVSFHGGFREKQVWKVLQSAKQDGLGLDDGSRDCAFRVILCRQWRHRREGHKK